MKSARMLLMALLVIGLATVAVAEDKMPPVKTFDGSVYVSPGGERQGGDTIETAVPITIPGTYYGTTAGFNNDYDEECPYGGSTAPDVVYSVMPEEDSWATLSLCFSSYDTKMYIYEEAAGNLVACNDDFYVAGCTNYTSWLFDVEMLAGVTYYIVIDGYGASSGDYQLDITLQDPPPPPPVNDDCAGAIDLQEQSLAVFEVDLCTYTNNYSPGEYPDSCTGYAANGPEAVYMIDLEQGETFSACVTPTDGFIDLSLYMITDCDDPVNSCVAGDDTGNPECISFVAPFTGTYYLMVDTYSTCGAGLATVTIDAPVSTEEASWSSIKSIFR
jgi:hypothetical protein